MKQQIILIEPLPDQGRIQRAKRLLKQCKYAGHPIQLVCEDYNQFEPNEDKRSNAVTDCRRAIALFGFGVYRYIKRFKVHPSTSSYHEKRLAFYEELITNNPQALFLIWNGQSSFYRDILALLHYHEADVKFVELGWLPQSGTYQLDNKGVNALSSLAQLPQERLDHISQGDVDDFFAPYKNFQSLQRSPKSNGLPTLLVPLQLDFDTVIVYHSPFQTMQEFIDKLELWVGGTCQVILRPHPLDLAPDRFTVTRPNFILSKEKSLRAQLKQCDGVLAINSTVAFEAAAHNVPVSLLGGSIFPSYTSIQGDMTRPFVMPKGPNQLLKKFITYAITNYQMTPLELADRFNNLPNSTP